MSKIRILGLDPGTANFGWAVTEFSSNRNFRPLEAGKIRNTVQRNMENIQSQTALFLDEFLSIYNKYKPQVIIIERFLNRGRFSGATGEYVSLMIGVISCYLLDKGVKVYITNSGAWKTAYNRLHPSKKVLDKTYAFCLSEPHELDAYLLTHYALRDYDGSKPFEHLKGSPLSKKQIQAFETISTGKKKKARK